MENVKDEFEGFGDVFKEFPRRLPEDCVEYVLHIINNKLQSPRDILARLEAVRKEAIKLTDRLLKDYIWQRDNFELTLKNENTLRYLHGLTNYGDSIEDEWLVVYLLKELSGLFPDLWIKVTDTDGEFLLIEAANALPRWLNPEIADNRVWIHNKALRIIPLSAGSPVKSSERTAPISRSMGLEEALQTITITPNILIHSPMVEEEAFYRLRNYPSQIESSMHHGLVAIPRKLAYILHQIPMSIAPAVESFYLRDPISLKLLQVESSNLSFPPVDLVKISVRFTKVLYAQLKSQQFTPPTSWQDILSSSTKEGSSGLPSQATHSQCELGMKVTSGFEMLVGDAKNEDDRRVRKIRILLEDLKADGDEILPSDSEISQWPHANREDDERWLDINFEDFERELDGKNRKKEKSADPAVFGPERPPGFGDATTQANLRKMVERFEAFLNDDDAGVDGAEIDGMDMDDDESDDDEEDSEDEDKDVSFDEEEFAKMMREMMGMPTDEDEKGSASKLAKANTNGNKRVVEVDSDDSDGNNDEFSKIRKVMENMEAELNEAGALNLDPTPTKLAALNEQDQKGKSKTMRASDDSEEESDGELNIDFNLAKNLLESFKSQGGMSGPGGNLMGMMGMQLPRDEDDKNSGETKM